MSLTIFAMVLAAAALHAAWNGLVKGGADKGVAVAAVVMGQGLFGVVALPFADTMNWACWPYLAASMALHIGYQAFLFAAYRVGDLTQVYPIARGSAPLIVACVSVAALGVALSGAELIAVAVIALGVMSLAFGGRGGGGDGVDRTAAGLALATGVFIAGYSMVDGLGARLAGSSLGFYGWVSVGNAVGLALIAPLLRPGLIPDTTRAWRTVVFGGGASFVAYALVVHAFTAAPIALVTALRETSIVFALLIGTFILKERVTTLKVVSIVIVVAGVGLLRLSQS